MKALVLKERLWLELCERTDPGPVERVQGASKRFGQRGQLHRERCGNRKQAR